MFPKNRCGLYRPLVKLNYSNVLRLRANGVVFVMITQKMPLLIFRKIFKRGAICTGRAGITIIGAMLAGAGRLPPNSGSGKLKAAS